MPETNSQRSQASRRRSIAAGASRFNGVLTAEATTALRELRARGAKSDAAAVCAALVAAAERDGLPSWVKTHEETAR